MAQNNLTGYVIKQLSAFALLTLFFPFLPAVAETIEAKLPKGITVTANFNSGQPSQPAVLLLHGFLQTHQSLPLSALANNLTASGYTTLSPTLSLGINKRSQSMPCEAVHTHTAEEGVAEIAYWVNWLHQKNHKNIVLVGFSSSGTVEILLYNAQGSHPAIKKTILTSLFPIAIDPAELQKVRSEMNARRKTDLQKPESFNLGYCKRNFFATANSYLSYAQFDANRVLELIKQSPLPLDIILGADDAILPEKWVSRINALQSPAKIRSIDKANHFFDGTNEFDLAEEVDAILKNLAAQPS